MTQKTHTDDPTLDSNLREEIREVMNARPRLIERFDKPRFVTDLVRYELEKRGSFCRTQDGRLLFFLRADRRLYDLEQKPFKRLLTQLSGLSPTETIFRFVLDILEARTAITAPVVDLHTLGHCDPGAQGANSA